MQDELKGFWNYAIHPNKIIGYYETIKPRSRLKLNSSDFANCEVDEDLKANIDIAMSTRFDITSVDNSHQGRISQNAARKINRAIDYIVYIAKEKIIPRPFGKEESKFYLSFSTLTLPSAQIHSDAEIMRECFQPMLNTFRQKFGVKHYLWRVEKQGNGNVHYHILADKFIPWMELRNEWNKHVNALGYVDRYRSGRMQKLDRELFGGFSDSKKHYSSSDFVNPNSTDVHGLRCVSDLKAYFAKYMTKSGQSSDVQGRLWGCSVTLSKLKGFVVQEAGELTEILNKLIDEYECPCFSDKYYFVINVKVNLLRYVGGEAYYNGFEDYIYNTLLN